MAEFVLKTQDILDDGRSYAFEVRPSWLATQLEGTDLTADTDGPTGTVELTASKSGADVVLRGHVQARVVATCARCLKPIPLDLTGDLTSLMTATGARLRPEPDTEDLTPEDLAREFFTGDEIVLDDLVRENLILEVPMQPHCADPECIARWDNKGESSEVRAPDPRLAALAALKDKLPK